MPDFSKRSLLPEKMDQPDVAVHEVRQALHELENVNKFLGGYKVILNALEKINWDKQPLTIIDLGCGGGDILRSIADMAVQKKRKVNLIGIDWNPVMTAYATEHSEKYANINFKTMNVYDDQLLKLKADISMNSLFCHHFNHQELVELIKRMYLLASQAVIVNDLHRNWFAYYSIKVITAVFSKTYLVKYDAPLSVARSLSRTEWQNIMREAGIVNYKLRWMWAWRWQLIILKHNK